MINLLKLIYCWKLLMFEIMLLGPLVFCRIVKEMLITMKKRHIQPNIIIARFDKLTVFFCFEFCIFHCS